MEARLSVWSSYYVDLDPEGALVELKKHGIDCTELSDEHGLMLLERGEPKAIGADFKKFADSIGIEVSQGHLWLTCRLCTTPGAVEILRNWLILYDAIGIKNAVLHCDSLAGEGKYANEEIYARNLDKLTELQETLKELNIRVCLENLTGCCRSADDINRLIDRLDEKYFGICLDTGHLNMCEQSQRDFIIKAGKRLHALHIADNEGKTDQHMMPFGRGNVDFGEVVNALRQVEYNGLFNLEIPGERLAPLEIRGYKLEYIRKCYEYLMNS